MCNCRPGWRLASFYSGVIIRQFSEMQKKHGTSPVLTSHPPCEQKSRRPARSAALSLDRLRATGGALLTSPPLAANTVYHTVSTPTSAKLPILSPAILPTLAKAPATEGRTPSQGLSHQRRYLNLRPVARLGLEAQPTVNNSALRAQLPCVTLR